MKNYNTKRGDNKDDNCIGYLHGIRDNCIDCGVCRNRNRKTVLVVFESAVFDLQFTGFNKFGGSIATVLLHRTSQFIT